MVRKLMNRFTEEMVVHCGNNLLSIYLTGSFVRGEQTADSDVDVICFFHSLSIENLSIVGKVINGINDSDSKFELNLKCLTLNEYMNLGFNRYISPLLYYEGQLIYGLELLVQPSNQALLSFSKRLLADSVMNLRNHLSYIEPAGLLTDGRLRHWVIKPLCVALRVERLLATSQFPFSYHELLSSDITVQEQIVVAWLMIPDNLRYDVLNDVMGVRKTLLEASASLMDRLHTIEIL
ncbi:nucleotidyltransferase domain-containing protein [Paenibacillus marinisediminis]